LTAGHNLTAINPVGFNTLRYKSAVVAVKAGRQEVFQDKLILVKTGWIEFKVGFVYRMQEFEMMDCRFLIKLLCMTGVDSNKPVVNAVAS
jgi:hypothetical protein